MSDKPIEIIDENTELATKKPPKKFFFQFPRKLQRPIELDEKKIPNNFKINIVGKAPLP